MHFFAVFLAVFGTIRTMLGKYIKLFSNTLNNLPENQPFGPTDEFGNGDRAGQEAARP